MTLWNERHLKELVRKMGLWRTLGQGRTPIHLALFGPVWCSQPFLNEVVGLATSRWESMGYTETDLISLVRYLGSLGCRTDDALLAAARNQQPLSSELARALIDVGCNTNGVFEAAVLHQRPLQIKLLRILTETDGVSNDMLIHVAKCCPLTPEITDFLVQAGADLSATKDGWDALTTSVVYNHLDCLDPHVVDLFFKAGCWKDVACIPEINEDTRSRIRKILDDYVQWAVARSHLSTENDPSSVPPIDWGR